jgi:hypothetical protein
MTTVAPGSAAEPGRPGPAAESGRLYGLMAEFDSPADILDAAERVRAAGYRWWDCCTPFPVHGLDKAMGIRPTLLPWLVFFGGATGTTIALILQAFTNASSFDFWLIVPVRGYDFLISGKPLNSLPAWIPVIFEMTVLLAALGCVGWLLLLNGLPRLYHPLFKSERFARATDDRFFLVIEARDPMFYRDETEDLLRSFDPISIEAPWSRVCGPHPATCRGSTSSRTWTTRTGSTRRRPARCSKRCRSSWMAGRCVRRSPAPSPAASFASRTTTIGGWWARHGRRPSRRR